MTKYEFKSAIVNFLKETPEWIETGRSPCFGHSHSVGYWKISEEAKARAKQLAEKTHGAPFFGLVCRYATGRAVPHPNVMEIWVKAIEELQHDQG